MIISKRIVTQCPRCHRYKGKPFWDYLTSFEDLILVIHKDEIEICWELCPDCTKEVKNENS